jgi:hypothetical protein
VPRTLLAATLYSRHPSKEREEEKKGEKKEKKRKKCCHAYSCFLLLLCIPELDILQAVVFSFFPGPICPW